MADTDAWMPLYIGDYLRDTMRLTAEQHGAYLLLIMDYWLNGPPPDDDQVLATIAKCSEHSWSNARAALVGYFRIRDGRWHHPRVDEERANARRKHQAAKEKGKQGAKARWGPRWDRNADAPGKGTSNGQGIAEASPKQCPTDAPSPSPVKTNTPPCVPPQGGKPAKGARIPDDWEVGPKERAFAKEMGLNDAQIAFEAAKFVDHWRQSSSRNAVKRDWLAAWRNWLRNDYRSTGPPRLAVDNDRAAHDRREMLRGAGMLGGDDVASG